MSVMSSLCGRSVESPTQFDTRLFCYSALRAVNCAFMIMRLHRTYHAHQFIYSFSVSFFCLFRVEPPSVEDDVDVWRYAILSCMPETMTCGELSWQPISFLLHVKYTYRRPIVSNNTSSTAELMVDANTRYRE